MKACSTVNCDGQLPNDSQQDRCRNCRATDSRWKKRPVAHVIYRFSMLGKYTARTEHIMGERGITPRTKRV
jgi:hypothetical protein